VYAASIREPEPEVVRKARVLGLALTQPDHLVVSAFDLLLQVLRAGHEREERLLVSREEPGARDAELLFDRGLRER